MVPNDLKKVISEAMGVDYATVEYVFRHLREAGLIASGGRGRSARRPEVGDAAQVIIALAASSEKKLGPALVKRFNRATTEISGEYPFFDFIPRNSSPVVALARVLTALANGEIRERLREHEIVDESYASAINVEFMLGDKPNMMLTARNGTCFAWVYSEPNGPREKDVMTRHQLVPGDVLRKIAEAIVA